LVVLTGTLGLAGLLPIPAAGISQEAALGLWRLMGGSLVLIGAFIQRRGIRAGGALSLLLGLFELLVSSVERDLIQSPYILLLSGAILATLGGLWSLLRR